ncbi:MAG: hypothetical protein FVQ81_05000 [Candidatus Glassbacteria bacterium]|nr:hypothetical protein [Candidatus Glassbacteria bacterium]
MKTANDRVAKKCFNPWFNFLLIFSVAALTLAAILVLDGNHVKFSFARLNFVRSFFDDDSPGDNILVAATGSDPASSVAVQFETCPYFLVVRESGGQYDYFSNSRSRFNENAMREFVHQQNIEAVITGTIEIGTFQALNASRVEIFTGVTGRVEDALKKYRKNELVTYSRHYHNRRPNNVSSGSGYPAPARKAAF